jgi:N-acyl amino acid synthase of PEP-CTERM/exosortase system
VSAMLSMIDAAAEESAGATKIAPESLVDIYRKYFDYRIVHSSADRAAAHQLRYDVYCEETNYLSKDTNHDGLERDDFDVHAVQSVLLHRYSGRTAGTVRLVLPHADQSGCALPARLFAPALDSVADAILPRGATAEISRFAIHPSFRRRLGDGLYATIFASNEAVSADFDPRRVIPHITLGLFASIFEMTRESNISHLCAIIDPALLRMLTRLGLHFHKAGATIDYHGPRQPVYASCAELLARVADEQPEIHELIVSSVGC